MSHFLEIICLLIISVSKQSVYGSTHALIDKHSEHNPKDCGITRFVPNLDYSCFKWQNNIIGGMIGRNATEDEVPWIIHIEIRKTFLDIYSGGCTGGLIADRFVLTAAHCIDSETNVDQYFLYTGIHSFGDPNKILSLKVIEITKHNNYSFFTDANIPLNDVALLKLDRSISSIKGKNLKSICLPQKNVFNAEQELALFGGWGMVDRDEWPLQVGVRRIYPSDDYSFWYSSYMIKTVKVQNKTLICMGDSGGLLWQYDSGRAVIIGVVSYGTTNPDTKCEYPYLYENQTVWFVRISKYIDWIDKVIKLN